MTLLGHDVSVRGWRFRSCGDVSGVDIVRSAGFENLFAERVFADKASAKKRERCPGIGEINQDVVGRSAGTLRLAADVSKLLGLGIDIDQFDLVDDPIAARKEATTAVYADFFHVAT